MIRFFIALWAAKLSMVFFKIRGKVNDWPGVIAYKLCPEFLKYIKKPKLVIAVTGTNGKTTTTNFIYDILNEAGYKKVLFNKGGANNEAGFILNLLHGVNIFNICNADASVLEVDEVTIDHTMPMVNPDYLIVTNISKDCINRNGHPENIFNHINRCCLMLKDNTTLILNGNDALTSNIQGKCKKVYCEVTDLGLKPYDNISKDIVYCPRCKGRIENTYRLYRNMGGFICNDCGYTNPKPDYFASKVDLDNNLMVVNESTSVKLISKTIYNAFNTLYVFALLKEMGYSNEETANYLGRVKMPVIRETSVTYNGIEYLTFASKGQSGSSSSTVFEYMNSEPSKKDIVLFLDELQDWRHPPETVNWIYETDYELLNNENINKIIVSGHMFLNHKLRLLLAGIPESKIIAFENKEDIPKYVSREGIEKVFVLFDIDFQYEAPILRDKIVEYAKEMNHEKN